MPPFKKPTLPSATPILPSPSNVTTTVSLSRRPHILHKSRTNSSNGKSTSSTATVSKTSRPPTPGATASRKADPTASERPQRPKTPLSFFHKSTASKSVASTPTPSQAIPPIPSSARPPAPRRPLPERPAPIQVSSAVSDYYGFSSNAAPMDQEAVANIVEQWITDMQCRKRMHQDTFTGRPFAPSYNELTVKGLYIVLMARDVARYRKPHESSDDFSSIDPFIWTLQYIDPVLAQQKKAVMLRMSRKTYSHDITHIPLGQTIYESANPIMAFWHVHTLNNNPSIPAIEAALVKGRVMGQTDRQWMFRALAAIRMHCGERFALASDDTDSCVDLFSASIRTLDTYLPEHKKYMSGENPPPWKAATKKISELEHVRTMSKYAPKFRPILYDL